jgi:aspartate/methionine/tyrosine aminotransferase
LNPLFTGLPETIFDVMSRLAAQHGAVNLGQGFPDAPGPEDVRAEAARALMEDSNQYPPMRGLPGLRAAVAEHYGRFHGVRLDPETEVVVTSGATEALAAAILSMVSPGDEVVLIQPLYDAYLPLVRLAGGVPRLIRLAPPHWTITEAELARVFSPRTRLVVMNNPINPAAVCIPRAELELLAEFCLRFDARVVADEVWEHVVFAPHAHTPIAALPGMGDRVVKIGSAGKIFALTGWKVGFLCGPPALAASALKAHQFLTFTTPPNLQTAVAYGLRKPDSYFLGMRGELARSRDRLTAGLRDAGYAVLPSQGSYFLNVDLTASGIPLDDETFCRRIVEAFKVAAIPVSAFYAEDPVRHIVRLCFAKSDAVLDQGVEQLAEARRRFI